KPFSVNGAQYLPEAVSSPPQYSFCSESASPTINDMWNGNTTNDHRAPNGALILRGGGSNGQWVVGQYFHTTSDETNSPVRPGSPYSTDGAAPWHYSADLDPQNSEKIDNSGTEQIHWEQPWDGDDPTWTAAGPAVFDDFPLIAADPSNSSLVYMVFTGRADSETTTNIDIFIAKSTDGGQSFAGPTAEANGTHVVRLTDTDLGDHQSGDSVGAVQFHPSIAVDQWGVIHVLYYVAWWVPPTCDDCVGYWKYKVRLAHIPSISFTE